MIDTVFSQGISHHIAFSGVNILNIQQKCTIGRYLGIHNVIFWKDHVNTKQLLLKISNKLAGWKKGTLSRAGRLTLINSNLSRMSNHVMSCFKCSKKITKAIDKQARNFLWGSNTQCPSVSWEKVCTPKNVGGLGIRPSAFFNNAAIAKIAWKLINDHDNRLSQILRKKYLRKVSFFEAKKKQTGSLAWKGILDARNLILKGMRWIVGNVADYIFNGCWNMQKLLQVLDQETVKQITGIPIHVSNQRDECIWGPATDGRFSIKSATWLQYQNLEKHQQSDLINKVWKLDVPPKVKLFGWLLLRGRLKTRDRLSKFGYIDDNSCPLCDNDNETADHLFGHCNFTTEVFRLAGISAAMDWHEGYLKVLREMFINQPDVITTATNVVATAAFHFNETALYKAVVGGGSSQTTPSTIRCTYNNFQRSNSLFSVTAAGFTLLKDFNASVTADAYGGSPLVKEFCVNIETGQRLNITFTPSKDAYAFINGIEVVSMPTSFYYTSSPNFIDTSASSYPIRNDTALEMVYRINVGGGPIGPDEDTGMYRNWDSSDNKYLDDLSKKISVLPQNNGNVILAAAKGLGSTTIPTAEATALRDSLVKARDRGYMNVQVEGDSKLVIDAINGKLSPPWRLQKIVQDIRIIATSFSSVCFNHVYRETNFVADAFVNEGHQLPNGREWQDGYPAAIARALLFDTVNSGCPRGLSL
ncbi:hypothetical protein ACLB2K_044497 [Fragaria x ananassa]